MTTENLTTTTVDLSEKFRNIRFVRGSEPVAVEQSGLIYQAGKLSYAGNKSIPYVLRTIKRFLKETYNFDVDNEAEEESAGVDALAAADALITETALLVLACDQTQTLTCANILEWPADFADECYKVAVRLNPKFQNKVAEG